MNSRVMAKLRSTSYMPTSTLPMQTDYSIVINGGNKKRGWTPVLRRISDAFVCNQATTHTGVLQSFAHHTPKKSPSYVSENSLKSHHPSQTVGMDLDDCILPQL
jgi:hypothetical protein